MLWIRSATFPCKRGGGALERANRARIKVVFQKEDLILKGLQDRRDLIFGTAHGAHVSGLARLCIAQHDVILRLQFCVIHGGNFALPFLEEVVADLIDGLNLVVELGRLRIGAFVIGV